MDIPFIRFFLPALILYLFWSALIGNPWVEEADEDASNPNSLSVKKSQALLVQSKALLKEGKIEQALPPSLQLYKAFPENHIYIEQLAQIYDTLGRYEDSAPMWEHYLQYAPTPTDGCPMLGFAYEHMDRPDDAFKAHERCWQFEPNNSDLIFFYAHGLERRGQYKRALELYQQGLKRSPHYPDLLIGAARAQAQMGQLKAAREGIEAVLATRPDNTDALLVAGLVFKRTGENAAAIRYLEHAHEVSPGYQEVATMLNELRHPVYARRR